MFCVACIIGGVAWFLFKSDFLFEIGYGGRKFAYLTLEGDVITCAIMAILLLIKIDVRFLSIPIIIEGLTSSRVCYLLFKRSLDTESNVPMAFYVHILLILSALIILALIFRPNKPGKPRPPLILYIIPGIFRAIYAIQLLVTSPISPLHIETSELWYSLIQFLGGGKAILSVAYILLGIMIKQLADGKSMSTL